VPHTPRVDFAFKKLFGSEENKDYKKGLKHQLQAFSELALKNKRKPTNE